MRDFGYEAQLREVAQQAAQERRLAEGRLNAAEARLAFELRGGQRQRAGKRITQLCDALRQCEAIEARIAAIQLLETAEQRRAELEECRRLMGGPAQPDKRIRQRAGLDDHLELGEHKPEKPRRVPAGPVTCKRAPQSAPEGGS